MQGVTLRWRAHALSKRVRFLSGAIGTDCEGEEDMVMLSEVCARAELSLWGDVGARDWRRQLKMRSIVDIRITWREIWEGEKAKTNWRSIKMLYTYGAWHLSLARKRETPILQATLFACWKKEKPILHATLVACLGGDRVATTVARPGRKRTDLAYDTCRMLGKRLSCNNCCVLVGITRTSAAFSMLSFANCWWPSASASHWDLSAYSHCGCVSRYLADIPLTFSPINLTTFLLM